MTFSEPRSGHAPPLYKLLGILQVKDIVYTQNVLLCMITLIIGYQKHFLIILHTLQKFINIMLDIQPITFICHVFLVTQENFH